MVVGTPAALVEAPMMSGAFGSRCACGHRGRGCGRRLGRGRAIGRVGDFARVGARVGLQ